MTNASDLLSKAPARFDDLKTINLYKPKKIRDRYGYQYLLKGAPKKIRGSIHREGFLDENNFALYSGAKIIISTKESLTLGDLIEYNKEVFAVKEQTSFNKVMDLNHYECEIAYAYYSDFIIDEETQAQEIIGTDCSRYLLAFALDKNLPLIASRFQPDDKSFFAFDIRYSRVLTSTHLNDDLKIEQHKQDSVDIYAVNVNTNKAQKFLYELQKSYNEFWGVGNFLSFSPLDKYNKAFDLKTNILIANAIINYKIVTSDELPALEKIKKVFWNFNFNFTTKENRE